MPGPMDGLLNALKIDQYKQHLQKGRGKDTYLDTFLDNSQHSNRGILVGDELPETAPPSWFQPDPLVVGQSGQARMAKQLLDADPITKQRTKQITFGPTKGTMSEMTNSSLPIDSFEGTNLMGGSLTYERPKREIAINPSLEKPEHYTPVLSHEIGHVAGWNEAGAEDAARITGGTLWDRLHKTNDPIIDGLIETFKRSR